MIAEHDPLVRPIAAANAAFDDEVRLDVGAHVDLQMQTRVLAAQSILERQPALPLRRRERTAQLLENRLHVAMRHRQRHDGRDRHGLAVIGIRFAPGVDAHPGVSGSPGTM